VPGLGNYFEEITPLKVDEEYQPDILGKSGDYKGKKVVGSDLAEEVKMVDFVRRKEYYIHNEKIKDS